MIIQRGYRVKLYPTKGQVQQLLQIAGACRWVYNYFLDRRKTAYLEDKQNLSYKELSRELIILRKGIDWLSEIQCQPLQQSLRQLDVAYNRFFQGWSRFPSFKSKYGRQSIRKVTGWSIDGNRIQFMRGMSIHFRGTFPQERQGTLTLTRDMAGQWWGSTLGLEEREEPELNGSIGIDLGLHHLAVTSERDKYPNLRSLSKDLKKLRFLSRTLSRKKKGSRNRHRAQLTLARSHRKVANRRLNHLHHVSKTITDKNHAMIAHENLAVVNMMKNHKLARHISDASWGEFLRQIQYKQAWKGGKTIEVDRFFPSSKTCSACGFILQSLPLNVRKWDCPACDIHHDRDVNAAININMAARNAARGDGVIPAHEVSVREARSSTVR